MAERDRHPEIPVAHSLLRERVGRMARYLPAVIAVLGGAAVTLVLAWSVRNVEDRRRLTEFGQATRTQADRMQGMLDSSLELLHAVAALYFSSNIVDQQEFHRFTVDALGRHSHVDSIAFAPGIGADGIDALGNGTLTLAPDVRIDFVPEGADPDGPWHPIVFAEPPGGLLTAATGRDIGVDAGVATAMANALGSGEAEATAWTSKQADETGSDGAASHEVRAVLPVFVNGKPHDSEAERIANCDGFVVCSLVPEAVVVTALEAGPPIDMEVTLTADGAGRHAAVEFRQAGGAWRAQDEPAPAESAARPAVTRTLHFAHRQWSLRFRPSTAYMGNRSHWPEWAVLLGGLGLTILFGGYLGLLTDRSLRISQQVRDRTQDLEREVAERKRTAATLRDSEALYQSLVGTIPLHLFRKDRDGRFTFANDKFCRALSRSLEEIIGRTDADFFPPAIAEKYRWDDTKVIEKGQVLRDIEEHPTGEGMRSVEVIKAPVRDANGRIIGVQGLFWDVTDRIRAQEELRKAAEELARSNSDLEQFAYIASHDLQEPLRMIASYLQLIEKRYASQLDDDGREFIGYAVDGAKRMRALITDLLAYSRVGTRGRDLEPVDAGAIVDLAVANLQIAVEEAGAEVQKGELPWVVADPTQLIQLFQNLIGNAIKFRSPERTPVVRIEAGPDPQGPGWWRFAVRDNGIGIDPKFADRIFAIFQRLHTPDQYDGTGIGLAVCKKIVERHGGRIWVESNPGEGSAFLFTLQRSSPLGVSGDGI